MIISASRRTDIPAFYAPWLLQRLREGYCEVANPFNPRQVSRIPLTPEAVDVLVFWTRNAAPLLPHLAELDARGYRYYFQYTLTGYGRVFEPGAPEIDSAINTIHRLADRIGPSRVCWRYDPIVLANVMPPAYHLAQFARLADALQGAVDRVTISVMDAYRAGMRRLAQLQSCGIAMQQPAVDEPIIQALLRGIADIAHQQKMPIYACAEPVDLAPLGILPGKCIDATYMHRVFGLTVSSRKDTSQRGACGCVQSKDIGAYDTCQHGCLYCYATKNFQRAAENYTRHQADAPALLLLAEGK
ncbi:MAG TPA: DUF1848 domain-containing protein [Armatimonadota bacterium]|nr:DUF1848 domain-containing protein [Armatimonadota bacterium]